MPIVTLTTDYGTKDHFVGALKGQLLTQANDIQLIDINHQIKPYDNLGASYVAKNAAFNFPKRSLHFIVVNIKSGNKRYLIVEKDEQIFICPDNGIISLMFPDLQFKAYVLPNLDTDYSYVELTQAFCQFYNQYKTGIPITSLAKETQSYVNQIHMQAIVMGNMIRAAVFYVDAFENVVVNVNRELFDQVVGGGLFRVSFRNYKIEEIHKHYSEVSIGEFVCIFNDAGFLEIAINQGNAAGLLGLHHGSNVLIEKL